MPRSRDENAFDEEFDLPSLVQRLENENFAHHQKLQHLSSSVRKNKFIHGTDRNFPNFSEESDSFIGKLTNTVAVKPKEYFKITNSFIFDRLQEKASIYKVKACVVDFIPLSKAIKLDQIFNDPTRMPLR